MSSTICKTAQKSKYPKEDRIPVLLTLNLEIPSFWETELKAGLNPITAIIYKSLPTSQGSCSGMIKIEGVSYNTAKKFLEGHGCTLTPFDSQNSLYHYKTKCCPLASIICENDCIENEPIHIREGHKQLSIFIDEKKVREFVKNITQKGMKIINVSKIYLKPLPEELLTSRQQDILKNAIKQGYYSFPKKINLNDFAKTEEISPSTLCVHLQKIEQKIMSTFCAHNLASGGYGFCRK